jgi:hypothetical protein
MCACVLSVRAYVCLRMCVCVCVCSACGLLPQGRRWPQKGGMEGFASAQPPHNPPHNPRTTTLHNPPFLHNPPVPSSTTKLQAARRFSCPSEPKVQTVQYFLPSSTKKLHRTQTVFLSFRAKNADSTQPFVVLNGEFTHSIVDAVCFEQNYTGSTRLYVSLNGKIAGRNDDWSK